MNVKETKKRIIQAGHKAVDELIKVAKEAIVDSGDDINIQDGTINYEKNEQAN